MKKLAFLPSLRSHHASLQETVDVLQRRRLLAMLGGAGAAALLPASAFGCSLIPAETAGPYPGDGTNGPNALTQSGIVRSDIRSSFGTAGTSAAAGTVMSITLGLKSTSTSCANLAGAVVYLWHCNAVGGYSMYSSGITAQNYLRGVQVSDGNGEVTFTSIFPGCYSGRWPHIHFEIYRSLAQATSGQNAVRTSQLALPETMCRQVYAQTVLYAGSTSNLNNTSLTSDNVFSNDGGVLQLATMTGSNTDGYVGYLEVGVNIDADGLFADGFDSV